MDPNFLDEDFLTQTRRIEGVEDLLEAAAAQVETGLLIETQQHGLRTVELSPLLIGRDPSCGLSLRVPSVSRIHSVIYKFGKHYVLRDLNSTNGVFLNGVQVYQAPIRPGDEIMIGDYPIKLRMGPPNTQRYSNQCTVIFMDIAGSTRYSEEYGEEFSQYVTQQLTRLENTIFMLLGCPVKNLGDGLMCVFGIWPVADQKYRAPDQALKAARMAAQFIEKQQKYPGLHMRLGLAFGEVSIAEKESFDLRGDIVNLAARLEYSNKLYGTRIMMSDTFVRCLSDRSQIREIDSVRVYGKNEPVVIYTWDEKPSETVKTSYHQGLELYRKGAFNDAIGHFTEAAKHQDSAGMQMAERVERILAGKEPQAKYSWDGVWNLDKLD